MYMMSHIFYTKMAKIHFMCAYIGNDIIYIPVNISYTVGRGKKTMREI